MRRVIATVALCAAGSVPVPSRAASVEELEAAIAALRKQVDALQARPQAVADEKTASAANAVTGGATKGSFKLPGSDTSITLGGYVKLDAVYSNPSAGVDNAADLMLNPSSIPVGTDAGDHERSQVKFGARETRLFVKTNTPTALGDLDTHVEFDFYGADGNESVSNSHGLRLRHAYATLGRFLAGQTWTNFMNAAALPDTVDFGGPAGQIFDRQAQVRWTQPIEASSYARGGRWSISLENPETVAQLQSGASFRADDDRIPDVTGQLALDTDRGAFSLHGIVRQLRVDSGASPAAVDGKIGAAIAIAGVVPARGRDDFRFTAGAGNGIGRYSNGFLPDAIVDAQGRLHLPQQWVAYGAYRHFWSETLRSSLVLSVGGERNPDAAPGDTNKATHSAHLNLIWSPVPRSDLGIEYIFADRETEDGQKGHLNRLQASAKYAF